MQLSFASLVGAEAALEAFRAKVDPDGLGVILWAQFRTQAKVTDPSHFTVRVKV